MLLSNVSLILSEVAELKNSHDLSSFATTINPVFFHLLGSVKFFDSILKISDIEDLLNRMRRCHQICLTININIIGRNFIQKTNETFDYPLFIQCVTSTIGLCLVSLEASTIQLNSSINCIMKMINMLEYWIGITSSLFIYCYLGTTIRELGLRVADAIYLSNWNQLIYDNTYSKYHNQPTSNQIKYIIRTVLMRSQRPIIINGGLFYILSLQTFKALVGCSLSNAIILRELSEDD
ncbi:odorant receptor 67c-like [Chelonus insularis]|uniref:odorant receptor 67c-like n=1 Tax=Chelonus insularis TaxID=460826 RepID=UPI00158842B9|nr:odorant receptor 67c-like [Chelonus insularis]